MSTTTSPTAADRCAALVILANLHHYTPNEDLERADIDMIAAAVRAHVEEETSEIRAQLTQLETLALEHANGADAAKAYSQQVVVNITEEMNGLKAGNARLLRELEELRRDKSRLDWLEAQGVANFGWLARKSTTGRGYRLHQDASVPHKRSPRSAIDAAMEASK